MWAINITINLASASNASYTCLMTLDEIIAAFKATDERTAGLAANMAHADELAPVVYAIADKFFRGPHLLPADNELLFKGLHVLAAARHSGLCGQVIAIAQQSAEQLDSVLPDHTAVSLARLPSPPTGVPRTWGFATRVLRSTKVGRNAPCSCCSGKKIKKCCGSDTAPLMC
jgi:hypothetical protein